MNDVVPIEYRRQPLHRPPGVPRPRLNVFPQNAPSVLNGANERILIGIIYNGHAPQQNRGSRLERNFRSRLALRFYVSEAIAIVARCAHKPRRTHKPRAVRPGAP